MRSILMSHRRNLGRQTVPLYFISKAVARNIQLSYSTTRYGCRNFADGQDLHKYSVDNLEEFWREAATGVDWMRPFDTVLDMSDPSAPHGKWFVCGQLNTAYNCIDRHIYAGRGDSLALIYDSPVTGVIKKFTFNELKAATVKVASVLRQKLKVKKGDRVIIYMPNIPEAAIAMLACARIGAVHSVVFGGFSSAELATRIQDCKPTAVLASSCGIEIQKVINYKSLLDSALQLAAETHTVKHCLVLQRQLPDTLPALNVPMQQGRDLDWAESVEDPQLELDESCEPMQSTDPLYILYTSGTTGQPKGVQRDNGGHAVALNWSMRNIYNTKPGDVYWAASDVGWVVGHSYSVYGPLLHGLTTVFYEGKPVGTPDAGSFWRVIQQHNVHTMFTAPTALRSIKRTDEEGVLPKEYPMPSLQTVFLAGERADSDSIKWAEHALGVPVRDHWWQTETGWAICSNLIGVEGYLPIKYGSTYRPCPGFNVEVLDKQCQPVARGQLGNIAIKLPLPPGSLQTIFNSNERFLSSYLKSIPGYYDTGDAGYIDEDGYVFVMSRTDDVINVAGHRLSSGAMEEVLADHHDVAEVAVVGMRDKLKGQVPLGLIVLNSHCTRDHHEVLLECVAAVRERIGPVAAFKEAVVVERLPKTRSGKILRGTMRAIANGDDYKIPATCEDLTVLDDVAKIIHHAHQRGNAVV